MVGYTPSHCLFPSRWFGSSLNFSLFFSITDRFYRIELLFGFETYFQISGLYVPSSMVENGTTYQVRHTLINDKRFRCCSSAGAKWKNRRRIITPAFHDRELLNNFVEIYNEQTAILVQRLEKLSDGKEVNLYPYIAACALDIICGLCFCMETFFKRHSNEFRSSNGFDYRCSTAAKFEICRCHSQVKRILD